MTLIDWFKNLFYGWNEPATKDEPDPKISELEEKGFHYNKEEQQWERTWLVATKTSAETSKEVWTNEDGGWRVAMYGDNGEVFFEYKVSEST